MSCSFIIITIQEQVTNSVNFFRSVKGISVTIGFHNVKGISVIIDFHYVKVVMMNASLFV